MVLGVGVGGESGCVGCTCAWIHERFSSGGNFCLGGTRRARNQGRWVITIIIRHRRCRLAYKRGREIEDKKAGGHRRTQREREREREACESRFVMVGRWCFHVT